MRDAVALPSAPLLAAVPHSPPPPVPAWADSPTVSSIVETSSAAGDVDTWHTSDFTDDGGGEGRSDSPPALWLLVGFGCAVHGNGLLAVLSGAIAFLRNAVRRGTRGDA